MPAPCRALVRVLLAMGVAIGCISPVYAQPQDIRVETKKFVPDEVLVRFRSGAQASPQKEAALHRRVGGQVIRRFRKISGLTTVKLPQGMSMEEGLRLYQSDPDVEFAEPNYIVRIAQTPNDPSFSQQWGLRNIGAEQAWNATTGNRNVVVGILDTGIDYTHEDLAANVYRNTADCNNNGIDDDGNGYVDDCYGVNAINGSGDPADDHFHGTNVAGIIGAQGNNGIGVAGVNWQVGLYPCKFLDATGSGALSDAIECFDFFALMKDRGVPIVATNNSWNVAGYTPASQSLFLAISGQLQRGILTVFAAGNDSTNSELPNPGRPSTIDLPNIISAAAIDSDEHLASFSNYGRHAVHLAAPGVGVLSTVPRFTDASGYHAYNGTSESAPHVTGAVALLKAWNPSLQWLEIKSRLLLGAESIPGAAQTITGGRLSLPGAMNCTNASLQARLHPAADETISSTGDTILLQYMDINCAGPNSSGPVTVTVSPSGDSITLRDDGIGPDRYAGDGIFTAQWIVPAVPAPGTHRLSFPNGDDANIHILAPYGYARTTQPYRTIAGTRFQFPIGGSDFNISEIRPSIPVRFGGASFSNVYLTRMGLLGLGEFPYASSPRLLAESVPFPAGGLSTVVAPFWDLRLTAQSVPGSSEEPDVYWEVVGTAPNRELVIEWRNLHINQHPEENVRFEVVFFENRDDILFLYADTVFGGTNSPRDGGAFASIGVQTAPNLATQFSYRSASVQGGDAILWSTSLPRPAFPSIAQLSPAEATVGQPFTLRIEGYNFAPGSVVRWHSFTFSTALATTVESSTVLTAAVPSTLVAGPGYAWVSVTVPDGGESNSQVIQVIPPPLAIASISPISRELGSASFTLTVNGTGFTPGSAVQWNGQNRPATFVSSAQLTVNVPTSDLNVPGNAQVAVLEGGAASAPATFSVTDFRISASAPSQTVRAGSSATFALQIEPQSGSFDRAVQLTISGLPAGSSGTFSPSMVTPGPASAALTLTVSTSAQGSAPVAGGWIRRLPPWLALVVTGSLGVGALLAGRRETKWKPVFVAGALALVWLSVVSCGGGASSSQAQSGTPRGTYTITITGASGSVTRTAAVTLVVE